jgi:hypothetical protein
VLGFIGPAGRRRSINASGRNLRPRPRPNDFLGRRPILAFGNSDGDLQMLQWTAAGTGRPPHAHRPPHTDTKREWVFDRHSHIGCLDKALDEANARGWTVEIVAPRAGARGLNTGLEFTWLCPSRRVPERGSAIASQRQLPKLRSGNLSFPVAKPAQVNRRRAILSESRCRSAEAIFFRYVHRKCMAQKSRCAKCF